MVKYLKNNIIVWVWLALAVFTELFSICFANCKPYLSEPLYFLLVFVPLALFLTLFRNKIIKGVLTIFFLAAQVVMCVGFIFMFEMNGTTFDFSMINQRNDAYGTIESLELNVAQTVVLCIVLALFMAFIITYLCICSKRKTLKSEKNVKWYQITAGVLCGVVISGVVLMPVIDGVRSKGQSYTAVLYNSHYSKYQSLGITANAVYEIFNGTIVNRVDTSNLGDLSSYLYEDSDSNNKYLATSEFNGVSKDNNLIVVMVESLDWHPFEHYSAEVISELYPNITKMMGESIVLNNYYSREKTDTSENNILLGSNPTGKYTNYDFASNLYPYALPNMFKNSYPDAVVKAYHQNSGSFYNRDELFTSYGFDDFISIEDMADYGVENTWNENNWSKGERTKDSTTISAMKEEMFPLDKQFLTYWLTFSMHGYYEVRENFSNFTYIENGQSYENGYYGYFDEKGYFPASSNKMENYLRTYACAVKDFDVSLGIMFDYLESNDMLDNTTILLFGDHNTYYNNLAYYAKGIDTSDYNSELYRIPCMIYDKKLYTKYRDKIGAEEYNIVYGNDNSETARCLTVSKFTTGVDIIPTIFDLFGIKGWDNLYLGSSVFIEGVESIIHSRAYGIFVTDKIVCYSINNPLYKSTDYNKEDFAVRAERHLLKQEYLDKIFYSNYFKTHEYVYPQ